MTFHINLIAGTDSDSSSITATGRIEALISNEERATFGLTDEALLAVLAESRGKAPDEVHVRNHHAFDQNNWKKVHRVMEVASAEIVSIEMEQVALVTNHYENRRGAKPSTHTATLTYAAAVSAATQWTASSKLTIEQKFVYKIGLPGSEIGGETRIGFEALYGQGGSETRTSTITTANAVTLAVDPGTTAKATLAAQKGVLRARVTFRAFLEGEVLYDYAQGYEGHHYYAQEVNSLMEEAGLPGEVICSQILEVGFYADARVIVTDDENPAPMQVVPAALTLD